MNIRPQLPISFYHQLLENIKRASEGDNAIKAWAEVDAYSHFDDENTTPLYQFFPAATLGLKYLMIGTILSIVLVTLSCFSRALEFTS